VSSPQTSRSVPNAFNFAQAPLGPVRMVTGPVPRGEHINRKEANQDT
jgi:hypothetical protein